MDDRFANSRARLTEISDLRASPIVKELDVIPCIPPNDTQTCNRTVGTFELLTHNRSIDSAIGTRLDKPQPFAESMHLGSDAASMIRVKLQDYEKENCAPAPFTAKFRRHMATSPVARTPDRPANDFSTMLPDVEKVVDWSRRFTDFLPQYEPASFPLTYCVCHESILSRKVSLLFLILSELLESIIQKFAEQLALDKSDHARTLPDQVLLTFGSSWFPTHNTTSRRRWGMVSAALDRLFQSIPRNFIWSTRLNTQREVKP